METTGSEMHWMNPFLRRVVHRFLNIPTVADSLPYLLYLIVTSGKQAFLALPIGYLIFVALWFPFWLLSFLTAEWGIYALFVAAVFFLGRLIIRLLAFPGSSHRVTAEVEKEFTKYSIRLLQASVTAAIDLAYNIAKLETGASNAGFSNVATSWKRVKSYRDRVMGVYYDVLVYIYREQPSPSVTPPNSSNDPQLTAFGNNRLAGDVGNLAGVTIEAQADGRRLMTSLGKVLAELSTLETKSSTILNNSGRFVPQDAVNGSTFKAGQALMQAATELKLVLPVLSHGVRMESDDDDDFDEDGENPMESVRRQMEREGGASTLDAIKAAAAAILPMLDPAPHESVFGMDVLRGTVLSRYKGASQMWFRRPRGGNIDAFHIPAKGWDPANGRNRKAVMYCNPNAGLIEVATGMSLAAGNCSSDVESEDTCWTDFYTQRGYDVYLFNYAGFGRSHGSASSLGKARMRGCFGFFLRMVHGTFCSFKPTPDSLRADAMTVGAHLINELGIDYLLIHGESIGGMAAAGAARGLTHMPLTRDKIALLICDRTFCNLQAVAQRLVGSWTGPAITGLAPLWNTDVAADFLAATCPKIVAQDSSDAIIADSGSLKSGIALWKEIRKEASTKSVGWAIDAPIEYRSADFEDVGVLQARLVPSSATGIQPPKWPIDRHLSLRHGFHFAACARRIGKLATSERRTNRSHSGTSDEEMGVELDFDGGTSPTQQSTDNSSGILRAWKALGCCDGLCGAPLGAVVKSGLDWTMTWLSCTLVFGGQVIAAAAESRVRGQTTLAISPRDFDCRPSGYEREENDMLVHPKPMPEVIDTLKDLVKSGDVSLRVVEHELSYCIGILEYVVARLSSPEVMEASRQACHFGSHLGHFMNLHCGHNSPFTAEERLELTRLLEEIMSMRQS